MSPKRVIRCSSLPMLFKCARSLEEVDIEIDSVSGPADLGTAVHKAMSSIVHGDRPDIDMLALQFGVDKDELGRLVWYGRQAWSELKPSFPNPQDEVEVSAEGVLNGHIDLLSRTAGHARFLDWKTGRKEEADYYAQMAGYALCIACQFPPVDFVTGTVVWLRSQSVETYAFNRRDIDAFADRLQGLPNSEGFTYGEHCAHCRRSHECPALTAMARRDVAIFSADDVMAQVEAATPRELVHIRRRARALQSFADQLDESIRRRIAATGPLDSGDGYQLALVEENGKREVDALKAWPVLQGHLSDEEMAECVTVSARKADDAVAKKAGRGQGSGAKRRLASDLEAAGAVTQTKVQKLKEIRLPRQLKGVSDE